MTLVLYSIFMIINFTLVLTKRKSKFLAIISILLIFLLMAGNISSLDNINYENHFQSSGYDQFSNQTFEPVFFFLMKFFRNIGFTWIQFRFTYLLALMPFFIYAILSIGDNLHIIMVLYMSHLIFLDSEQLRNFGGIVFLLLGFSLYLKNEKTSDLIICIFLACLFHYAFIVYFLFVGLAQKKGFNKKFVYLVVCMSIILAGYTLVNGGQIPFLSTFLQNESFNNERINRMATKRIGIGFIIPVFFLLINTIIANIESKILLNSNEDHNDRAKNLRFKLIYYCTLVLFSLTPLFFMSTVYYRLIRNMNILIIVLFSYVINLRVNTKSKLITMVFMFLWQIAWITFDIFVRMNEVFIPFFTENFWH